MKKKYISLTGIILILFLSLILLGCPGTGSPVNQAPYPVTGPSTPQDFVQGTSFNTFQLEIEEQGGLVDPDGDTVYFKSSSLPSWITLDENTGVVTVDTVDLHSSEGFSFWSEDEHGSDTSETPLIINISVYFS